MSLVEKRTVYTILGQNLNEDEARHVYEELKEIFEPIEEESKTVKAKFKNPFFELYSSTKLADTLPSSKDIIDDVFDVLHKSQNYGGDSNKI